MKYEHMHMHITQCVLGVHYLVLEYMRQYQEPEEPIHEASDLQMLHAVMLQVAGRNIPRRF